MRVSQTDIARQAGVDKSTVSLALRNDPSISATTRQRIKLLAERLGYRPDPTMALIAHHRWSRNDKVPAQALAYVTVPERDARRLAQDKLLAPATERAAMRGYLLQRFKLSDYPSGAALSRVLFHRGIRGILLAPLPPSLTVDALQIDWARFTIVGCLLGWQRPPVHVVEFDWFESVQKAWRVVEARGYRRIGAALVGHQPPAINDTVCRGAVQAAQSERKGTGRKVPMHVGDFSDQAAFVRWYRRYRPDVILGFHDGMYHWLKAMGLRVPEDVGFVSFNVTDDRITGMRRDHRLLGAAGIDYLIAKMREFETGVPSVRSTLLIEPEWNEATSLLPVRGKVRHDAPPGSGQEADQKVNVVVS